MSQTALAATTQAPMNAALRFAATVFRPLIRTLMRFGVSSEQVSELTRWLYVDEFYKTESMWTRGRPIASRAALLSGLTRREVQRLRLIRSIPEAVSTEQVNRAARVLNGWLFDKRFQDTEGKPSRLPMQDAENSFAALVSQYSGDVTPKTVMDELIRAGCIQRINDDVVLINPTYGANAATDDLLNTVGFSIRSLCETIEYNLTNHNSPDRKLQRLWIQQHIPVEALDEVKVIVREAAIKTGRAVDGDIAKLSHAEPALGRTYVQAGIGIYYFEDYPGSAKSHG